MLFLAVPLHRDLALLDAKIHKYLLDGICPFLGELLIGPTPAVAVAVGVDHHHVYALVRLHIFTDHCQPPLGGRRQLIAVLVIGEHAEGDVVEAVGQEAAQTIHEGLVLDPEVDRGERHPHRPVLAIPVSVLEGGHAAPLQLVQHGPGGLPRHQAIELLIELQLAYLTSGDTGAPAGRHDPEAHRLGPGLWPQPLQLEVQVDLATGPADEGPRTPAGNGVFETALHLSIRGQPPDGLIQAGTELGHSRLQLHTHGYADQP